MKLVRMHIQGFKSFKDRTTIHFDKGITGIVGPNGCGKSNIVDALFWVMGEQSAKHLRGKSMKDLIFSGSSKYNPGSWAEVTLVLENDTGKHIHIMNQVSKPAEIALTRKLYRNGDTEYRINNIPARLKDIQEVFMDTGAGAKSYSIIAQGEINRLVQAKPEERRVMIEEVAGITKFKLRKRDSLKKIEHTQANLSRLEDLQTEIYKNLKSLERQAEKAEKARTLKDRIKRHELIKESHKEHDFLKDFKEGKSLLVEKETILEESTLKREALELTLEDERNKKVDIMEKVNTAQEEFNELSKLLAAAEERLNYLKKSGGEKEKYIEEKVHENTEIQNDLGSRTTRHEEISNQVEVLESSNPEDADFSEMEERVELLKENLRDKEDALNLLKSELEEAKDRFSDIDQREFKNTSKLEEFASSLQDINAEIESLEEHSSNFTDELTSQREQLRLSTTKKEELKGLVTESKEKVISLEAEHKDLDANIRTFSREVITLESKRESLISINDTEDVSEGANQFLEQVEGNTFNLMGKLIESEPEYGTALEALFGEHFESMISNDGIFDSLIDWNKDNNNNLLAWDLISVNNSDSTYTETAERLEVRGCSNILAVNEIVKVNESGFRSQLSQFFNGFFVVDNLTGELALKVSKDISFKGIVSKDGSIFVRKTDGNFKISVRNSDDAGQGVVQRNNLINELTESLEVKEVDLRNMETRFTELCNEREQVKLNFETQNAEYIETNNNFIKLKTSLESKESNFKTSFSRLEILNNRKSEISTTRLDLLEIED
ncbi:MAG: chromosome segregation protein, partial [Thermoproteota archaeon]